ncbi:MAG: 2Fe-2S iron-sulfur cluster-binding protein [Burkholderiales bacterium]|nr:2Fe-2S iron-sulfur cluster-binding protein [Burkholderiales bacterium]
MTFKIVIADSPFVFTAEEGETIAQAAERHDIQLKLGCGQGACGLCKGKVFSGHVDNSNCKPFALTEDERQKGYALYCTSKPLSDLVIENIDATHIVYPPTRFRVEVLNIIPITDDTLELVLGRTDNKTFDFLAGQAINFELPNEEVRSYSMSSPSTQKNKIELVIRHIPGGLFTDPLFSGKVTVGSAFNVQFPLGSFFFRTPIQREALFLATGTGIAPVMSILRTLKAQRAFHDRKITVYWGAKTPSDLYFRPELENLQNTLANFRFVPVVSRDPAWKGETGHVQQVAAVQHGDMRDIDVYLCGSTQMVRSASAYLSVRCGLKEENTFSDAFGGLVAS